MKRLFAITGAMILFTAIFFVVASAGGPPVKQPLQGMWAGINYTPAPCPDTFNFPPGAILVVNVGQGVLSHMGKSNFIAMYCQYFNEDGNLEGSVWNIVTGADGDTLHLSVEISSDLSAIPPKWMETETIVGGTGKFKDATGEANSSGILIFGTDTFPFGESIAPVLLDSPQGWIGTTSGWVKY